MTDSLRASWTLPPHSQGFVLTPLAVWELSDPSPLIWMLPLQFLHDLSTIFALPSVWRLLSHFPHGLRASLTINRPSEDFPCTSLIVQILFMHFSHGLRTSPLLPSQSEDFPHTSLMVWVLPSYFPHSLWASLTIYRQSEGFLNTSTTFWGLPSHNTWSLRGFY
jgi:hypothetical protein